MLEGRATREDCEDDRHTACRVRSWAIHHANAACICACSRRRLSTRAVRRPLRAPADQGVDEERLAGVRELRGGPPRLRSAAVRRCTRRHTRGGSRRRQCTEASFGLADKTFDTLVIGNGQLARRLPGHGGREGDDRDLDPIPVELLEPAVEPMSVEIDLEAPLVAPASSHGCAGSRVGSRARPEALPATGAGGRQN